VEASFFPEVASPALATAISAYQDLGCWEGPIEIRRDLYAQSLAVFEHAGEVHGRHPYDRVCIVPPSASEGQA
jgi:hypothetical protein